MIRQWMEYQGKAVTINPNRARVRLNNKCVLVLNRVAHQRLGSPEAVVLLYDPRYRVVGLRAAAADRNNAFPLKQRYKKGSNGSTGMLAIYATGFFKLHGLKPERTIAFDDPKIEDGVLELDLRTARELNG